jgi:hypothetical protein
MKWAFSQEEETRSDACRGRRANREPITSHTSSDSPRATKKSPRNLQEATDLFLAYVHPLFFGWLQSTSRTRYLPVDKTFATLGKCKETCTWPDRCYESPDLHIQLSVPKLHHHYRMCTVHPSKTQYTFTVVPDFESCNCPAATWLL